MAAQKALAAAAKTTYGLHGQHQVADWFKSRFSSIRCVCDVPAAMKTIRGNHHSEPRGCPYYSDTKARVTLPTAITATAAAPDAIKEAEIKSDSSAAAAAAAAATTETRVREADIGECVCYRWYCSTESAQCCEKCKRVYPACSRQDPRCAYYPGNPHWGTDVSETVVTKETLPLLHCSELGVYETVICDSWTGSTVIYAEDDFVENLFL